MVLRYLLPSVVDISGAGIKDTGVINEKTLQKRNKTKYYNFKYSWYICYL